MLGAGHVTAVDIDRRACRETERNLALNGISGGVVVVEGGIRSAADRYDAVLANLRTPVLAGIVEDVADRLGHGGVAILSGILERELHPFLSLAGNRRLDPLSMYRFRGWMTLVLEGIGPGPRTEAVRYGGATPDTAMRMFG
jgi:ribosomal protein L11 methyltransferase